MFTGIIEELGTVTGITKQPDALRLTIKGKMVLDDLKRGDSISCSGTCLTAIEIDENGFTADVMMETIKLTSLMEVVVGDPINLERAMNAQTRYGGHVVQGHIDGVGEFVSRETSENWDWVRIRIPRELLRYVVMKGSITFDGISLTVNEISDDVIGLSLIPETLQVTTLGSKKPGSKVNVEVDVMAKHIERLMEFK
ncbi:riboflavin synthase, alpha subunit [Candidatus Aquiluna sp. IMCC13023]|jgi:riboflavin synthase|uniref:riboflavin synthase n=1 Tax=Candidatus Aquiluna sp. IMCC13023 TaxID=1081644 RepID=UPI00025B2B4E|nr:riboflavin synthase [Candidatus Aquiluna sp. IMCC13023]EIC92034.1 riboflavin synthase, alpha subunit [Candidatus Aquiluna sp. IMCC13023]